jgi:cytochrome c oxidase subunit 3
MIETMVEPLSGAESHEDHRDDVGARLGFWLFLYTEIFLFAVMFILYSVYRNKYLQDFQKAALELNTTIGTVNTLILLLSSMTVVLSIVAIQRRERKRALVFIAITILCGLAFLNIKSVEWAEKFHHGIFLQTRSAIEAGEGSPLLTAGEQMLPQGQVLFYSLYYVMTGTHALHILIGLALLLWCFIRMQRGSIHAQRTVALENVALYWHLVDVIWIFLFPLFYLVH